MTRPHSTLSFSLCSSTKCHSTLVAKLRETQSLEKVTTLTTHFALDIDWSPTFTTWSQFSALETLALSPYCAYKVEVVDEVLNSAEGAMVLNTVPQKQFLFPSIQTLVWHQHAVIPEQGHIVTSVVPILFQTLKNVTTLKFLNVTKPLLSGILYNCEGFLPRVRTVSLLTTKEEAEQVNYVSNSVFDLIPTKLSRLEFNPYKGSNDSWEHILRHFEATLEHLTLRPGSRCNSPRVLSIAPLPKLKVFQIFLESMADQHVSDLEINFRELDWKAKGGIPLDWGWHFASLTRLEVGREKTKFARNEDRICETFLVKTFLYGTSQSVRRLIIPKHSDSFATCEAMSTSLNCGVAKEEFCEKVVSTFPNLDNLQIYK